MNSNRYLWKLSSSSSSIGGYAHLFQAGQPGHQRFSLYTKLNLPHSYARSYAHRMGVWRSRPALAYDPDVESGIRDDDDDDDLAELAVAYFERLNELDRASVVHEPRSLAELAFAAIPVTEPLDDWTSNQVYYFGPAGQFDRIRGGSGTAGSIMGFPNSK
ncbi:hypothetical protein quinque_007726 [Culex quinquefasciatus]